MENAGRAVSFSRLLVPSWSVKKSQEELVSRLVGWLVGWLMMLSDVVALSYVDLKSPCVLGKGGHFRVAQKNVTMPVQHTPREELLSCVL